MKISHSYRLKLKEIKCRVNEKNELQLSMSYFRRVKMGWDLNNIFKKKKERKTILLLRHWKALRLKGYQDKPPQNMPLLQKNRFEVKAPEFLKSYLPTRRASPKNAIFISIPHQEGLYTQTLSHIGMSPVSSPKGPLVFPKSCLLFRKCPFFPSSRKLDI